MKNRASHGLCAAAVLAAVFFAGAAHADSTWSATGCSGTSASNSTGTNPVGFGNQFSCSLAGNPTMNATGWASGTTTAGSAFAAAGLVDYGAGYGLGILSGNEVTGVAPDHAIDNNVKVEGVLLNFVGGPVSLTQIVAGWTNTDFDFSLWRYTGASAPVMTNFKLASTQTDTGWSLVNNYNSAAGVPDTTDVSVPLGATGSSSWWLVSAYSSTYGGNTAGLTDGNDYFKLLSVVASVPTNVGVPEPGSAALVLLALGSAYAASRRRA